MPDAAIDIVGAARQLTTARRPYEFAPATSRSCPPASLEKLRRLHRRAQERNESARRIAEERREARLEMQRFEALASAETDARAARDARVQARLKRDLELARAEYSRLCVESDAAGARSAASVALANNLVKWLRSAGYAIPEEF